jgi:hypothetical protein
LSPNNKVYGVLQLTLPLPEWRSINGLGPVAVKLPQDDLLPLSENDSRPALAADPLTDAQLPDAELEEEDVEPTPAALAELLQVLAFALCIGMFGINISIDMAIRKFVRKTNLCIFQQILSNY